MLAVAALLLRSSLMPSARAPGHASSFLCTRAISRSSGFSSSTAARMPVDQVPDHRLGSCSVAHQPRGLTISRPNSHNCRRYCFGFMPRGIAMQLLPALQILLVLPADLFAAQRELRCFSRRSVHRVRIGSAI